jgi:hypothetical protein
MAEIGDLEQPADRERLELLRVERARDLAAVLSDADRKQVELRASASARANIDTYGDILASEAEYQRLDALRKTFDDRRQLNDEIRALLGNERWDATTAEAENERRSLATLSARLGLPDTKAQPATGAGGTHAAADSFPARQLRRPLCRLVAGSLAQRGPAPYRDHESRLERQCRGAPDFGIGWRSTLRPRRMAALPPRGQRLRNRRAISAWQRAARAGRERFRNPAAFDRASPGTLGRIRA